MRRCSHREEMHPIDRVKVYIISPDKFPVNLYNYHKERGFFKLKEG